MLARLGGALRRRGLNYLTLKGFNAFCWYFKRLTETLPFYFRAYTTFFLHKYAKVSKENSQFLFKVSKLSKNIYAVGLAQMSFVHLFGAV